MKKQNTLHNGRSVSTSHGLEVAVCLVLKQLLWDTVDACQRGAKRNGFPNMLLAVFSNVHLHSMLLLVGGLRVCFTQLPSNL